MFLHEILQGYEAFSQPFKTRDNRSILYFNNFRFYELVGDDLCLKRRLGPMDEYSERFNIYGSHYLGSWSGVSVS